MDILEHRKIKGRKDHRCCLCELRIDRGTEHWYQVVINCGTFYHHRIHLLCMDIADEDDFEYQDGWSFREWHTEVNNICFSKFKKRIPSSKRLGIIPPNPDSSEIPD